MKIKNIDEFFPKIINLRGYEYFGQRRISDVFTDGNRVFSHVLGEKTYNTTLTIEKDYLVKGTCTCPYYQSQKSCKHMAALAYYINNNANNITVKPDLATVVKNMSKQELQMNLLKLLKNDFNYRVIGFDYLTKIDKNIQIFCNYIDYLFKKNFFVKNKEKVQGMLLEISAYSLPKAYYLLLYILKKDPVIFYQEALDFIDISIIHYKDDTSTSIIYDLIRINDDYLEGFINIYIKNHQIKFIKEIIKYVEELIKYDDGVKYKKFKLRLLLNVDSEIAKKYSRYNLDKGKLFLNTYLSLEKDYEDVLLDYLYNYNQDFITKKADIIAALERSSRKDIVEKVKEF